MDFNYVMLIYIVHQRLHGFSRFAEKKYRIVKPRVITPKTGKLLYRMLDGIYS